MGSEYPKSMDSSEVPPAAGVYIFSRGGVGFRRPVYIGSSRNLKGRIISGWTAYNKRRCVVSHKANRLHILLAEVDEDFGAIERDLIKGYHPPCNEA